MQDDFESPYFDWENDRLFDESTRGLIDRIANDSRFSTWSQGVEIVEELAPHKGQDEQQRILQAAWEIFELTVRPGVEARASQLVVEALADPGLDALPVWGGESLTDGDNSGRAYSDSDPRVAEEFTRQLAASDVYQHMQEEARGRAESEARDIVGGLPALTRDRLVLASRNADRELLLTPWIEGASHRRRGWVAYYAQGIARQDHEESVLDRYSAATKILAGQGWSKKAIADAIEIGVGRVDRLLERTTGQSISDNDPLCDLVPDLRGSGDSWRDAGLMLAHKPKPFSRLSVGEKVALAEESTDPKLLTRLAKDGSQRIFEALINRYCQRGDLGDDILQTMLIKYSGSWMQRKMIEAHHLRPLPVGSALALAAEDARVLFECDDATALAAKSLGRMDFEVALAVRDSDVDAIERFLTADSESESHRYLVDLLIERPLTVDMRDPRSLLATLVRAAEQTDDLELRAALRLIACQSPEILLKHIDDANTSGTAVMSPEAVVAVALGEYHSSGDNTRSAIQGSARAIWEATDFTVEQGFARTIVAEHGRDAVTFETSGNVYLATADAIRSFRKSETTQYTYVHMRITSAVDVYAGNLSNRMPISIPALGYHREMRKHPVDPDGPEVEAIVWPIPFQPAVYSIATGFGESARLIAVNGSKVAVISDEAARLLISTGDLQGNSITATVSAASD
jgi:hypothetical protein